VLKNYSIFSICSGNSQTFEVYTVEIPRIDWKSRISAEKPRRSYPLF